MDQITVFIANGDFVIRTGLRSLLQSQNDIKVLGEGSTCPEALQWLRQTSADVILMDILMPAMGGVRGVADVLRVRPESKVLVVTAVDDPLIVLHAILTGARGYLVHGQFTPESLIQAIRTVWSGDTIITPSLAPVLLDLLRTGATEVHARAESLTPTPLSSREEEVLSLIAIGKGNPEIAETLRIEVKTVKNHVNSIYSKLHLKSRYEAISHVLRG